MSYRGTHIARDCVMGTLKDRHAESERETETHLYGRRIEVDIADGSTGKSAPHRRFVRVVMSLTHGVGPQDALNLLLEFQVHRLRANKQLRHKHLLVQSLDSFCVSKRSSRGCKRLVFKQRRDFQARFVVDTHRAHLGIFRKCQQQSVVCGAYNKRYVLLSGCLSVHTTRYIFHYCNHTTRISLHRQIAFLHFYSDLVMVLAED